MKKFKNGFTLIELMVVIVIIGILVAIALPNFIAAQGRAKQTNVKTNSKTYQTLIETYAVDWNGQYPNSSTSLASEASAKGYDKVYKNPFTGAILTTNGSATKVLAEVITGGSEPSSWTGIIPYIGGTDYAGQVIYRRSLPPLYDTYAIYSLDGNANFILDNGRVFMLSNK